MVLKMKSNLYPEECCEHCREIIHCHFDCPVCNGYMPTDLYGEACLDNENNEFSCENCRTDFKIISRQNTERCIAIEIEVIKNEK